MAGQFGKSLLIKVDSDGAGTFLTVGGLRTKSISLNAETIDITDSDSTGLWRELLDGGGIKTASISGAGVFKDTAAEDDVRGYYFAGTIREYQAIIPDFGTIEGLFQITSLEYAGEHGGEATFSMTLESAGELSWTAA